MFTRGKIAKLERQLENSHNIIDAKQNAIDVMQVQISAFERLVKRLESENHAELALIDGLERAYRKSQETVRTLDEHRLKVQKEKDAVCRRHEMLMEAIKTIERDGLCCICQIGASRGECGATCNFKFKEPEGEEQK